MQKTSFTARSQHMYALIEKYLSSKSTQKQFCQKENIAVSTFSYWLRHYQRNNQDRRQLEGEFIPLHFTSENAAIAAQPTFAVEYPNGVVVRLFGPINIQVISQLVSIQAT